MADRESMAGGADKGDKTNWGDRTYRADIEERANKIDIKDKGDKRQNR
jgi:hypothetical protein